MNKRIRKKHVFNDMMKTIRMSSMSWIRLGERWTKISLFDVDYVPLINKRYYCEIRNIKRAFHWKYHGKNPHYVCNDLTRKTIRSEMSRIDSSYTKDNVINV